MKAFIAGVITLSLLISAVSINAFFITRKTDELISLLEAMPDYCREDAEVDFLSAWESAQVWIALTVDRKNVDDIDDTLKQLRLHCREGNTQGYLVCREKLLCTVKRLKKTESFSLSRIF